MIETDPTLLSDLQRLVDPVPCGDPMSPLKWTSQSLRHLSPALCALGHQVGRDVARKLLKKLGSSLRVNRRTLEGSSSIDRDAQFHPIADTVKAAIAKGQPAISVGTKKKELVGGPGPLPQLGENSSLAGALVQPHLVGRIAGLSCNHAPPHPLRDDKSYPRSLPAASSSTVTIASDMAQR